MSSFLNYIIEANLSLILLLAFYGMVFRKETDFRLQRIILLAAVIMSLTLPLIHIETARAPSGFTVSTLLSYRWLPEVVIGTPKVTGPGTATGWEVADFLITAYSVGLAAFLSLVIVQLVQLLVLIRRSTTYRRGRLKIAESIEDKPIFSFFNFVFIGKAHELSATEKDQIIRHESIHAQQWHSLDMLLIHILRIVFWFNPFLSIYKKIFIQLHEFEADARSVEDSDVNKYCNLLARVALKSAGFTLANHFNNSLTVKRIEMMRTIKSNIKRWKLISLAGMTALLFAFVACQDQVANRDASGEEVSAQEDKIFTVVEEVATFKGGLPKLIEHLQQNISYPADARKAGIGGTVHIEFVVEKDGTLSNFRVKESVHPDLDAEALRVVQALPPWNPARQNGKPVRERFVIPISFNPDQSSAKTDTVLPDPDRMEITIEETSTGAGKIVKGIVRDVKTGDPLPGTNIVILGTTTGTVTDLNGRFQLETPAKGQLVGSFVGYQSERLDF